MGTNISDFRTSFYIPAIQRLAFHLPYVHILGTNHCGEMRRTAFKQRVAVRTETVGDAPHMLVQGVKHRRGATRYTGTK